MAAGIEEPGIAASTVVGSTAGVGEARTEGERAGIHQTVDLGFVGWTLGNDCRGVVQQCTEVRRGRMKDISPERSVQDSNS